MKKTWAEYSFSFLQNTSDISGLLTLTKKYFKLSHIHLLEFHGEEAFSLDRSLQFKATDFLILKESPEPYSKVNELPPQLKKVLKEFSGILSFHQNYTLKYAIVFKGKVSPKKLYAHLFPYLNNILKIELAEKKVQEDFLCRINHELKTPLNAIIGQLHLLPDEECPTKQSLYISGAQKSAQDLLNRIDNLLIYAKYTDEFVFSPTKFSINSLIKDLTKEFEPLFSQKSLAIELESLTTDCDLYTDPYYVKRILYSLLENACTFTKEGKVTLSAEVNNSEVNFKVKDTGIGFPPELIELIQKKAFIQEENYQNRTQKGTGLSLNLCFKIIKNLGGEIKISSQRGTGSTVTVSLPILKPKDITVNKFYGRVLVVEDESNNQLIAKKYLQKLGFNVDVANHGQEAMALYEKGKYTFILMDCQMPVMDGYEATAKIRSKDKEQLIIACTAHALNESKQKCLDVGMNGFLTKPLTPQSLKNYLFEIVPECADNFDDSFPSEIVNSEDDLNEGLNFISNTLLTAFKSKVNEDFAKLESLPAEELRKTFHRLKSTYAQLGFIKSQKVFSVLQKTENFNKETFHQIKKQTYADLIALEQWVSNQKEMLHASN